jgi:bifunctional non-homologous end joining protein LigD
MLTFVSSALRASLHRPKRMLQSKVHLTREPLEGRRKILRTEVMPLLPDSIRYSETLDASAAALIDAVREQGIEGIVAKRRASLYEPG